MVLFVKCSVMFHLRLFSFIDYVALRYIQLRLGNKVIE